MPLNEKCLQGINTPVFIETGSHLGDGVSVAFDHGFQEIHSIDMSPKAIEICQTRFQFCKNVTMHLGNSAEVLPSLLSTIDKPVTFWLDAHAMTKTEEKTSKDICPILSELECILKFPHKSYLLVDDMWLFRKKKWKGISDKDIERLVEQKWKYIDYYTVGRQRDVLYAWS